LVSELTIVRTHNCKMWPVKEVKKVIRFPTSVFAREIGQKCDSAIQKVGLAISAMKVLFAATPLLCRKKVFLGRRSFYWIFF